MLIGWMLKTRRIPGKLTVLDAGAGLSRFNHLFAERYPDQIVHRPHTDLLAIDPFARTISTNDGDAGFDHAILFAPCEPAPWCRTKWPARQQRTKAVPPAGPVSIHSACIRQWMNASIWSVICWDTVSPLLFGYYPKTAHIAARQGAAAALQIAALSQVIYRLWPPYRKASAMSGLTLSQWNSSAWGGPLPATRRRRPHTNRASVRQPTATRRRPAMGTCALCAKPGYASLVTG